MTSSSRASPRDTATSATAVDKRWLTAHTRSVKGKTVLTVDGKQRTLPRADLVRIDRGVASA